MIKTIGIGAGVSVAVALAGVLGFAATRPDTFEVKRATTIQAAPAAIQPLVTDFHRWTAWSPYEKLDPKMKRAYEGAPAGKGAVYTWNGDGNAGAGRMEILDVTAEKVTIKLDFTAPFQASNVAAFSFVPKDGGTEVTWSMAGPQPLVAKVMCLFMDMDAMVGKDFEAGLAGMKAIAEKK